MKKKGITIGAKVDRLTRIVERGFSAVSEDVADIRKQMATKDELREEIKLVRDDMATGFEGVRRELRDDIRRVEMKVEGIDKRLDYELDKRKTLEIRIDKVEARH